MLTMGCRAEFYDWIQRCARDRRLSVSTLMELALVAYLEAEGLGPAPLRVPDRTAA